MIGRTARGAATLAVALAVLLLMHLASRGDAPPEDGIDHTVEGVTGGRNPEPVSVPPVRRPGPAASPVHSKGPAEAPGTDAATEAEGGVAADAAAVAKGEADRRAAGLPAKRHDAAVTDAAAVRYFARTRVVIMFAPSRYHTLPSLRRHYERFFPRPGQILYYGPKNATVDGTAVRGRYIGHGALQYRAMIETIDDSEAENNMAPGAGTEPPWGGYLYIADDVLLHPWALVWRSLHVPWGVGMGIANVRRYKAPLPPASMDVTRKRRAPWQYWARAHKKLNQIYDEHQAQGSPSWGDRITAAAAATPRAVYKRCKWTGAPEDRRYSAFFTIMDVHYVPAGRMARDFNHALKVFIGPGIFCEMAVPTALRYASTVYEVLDLQFYWRTGDAKECPRDFWRVTVDGFHKCQHDHPFADAVFDNATRAALLAEGRHGSTAQRLAGLSYNAARRKPEVTFGDT